MAEFEIDVASRPRLRTRLKQRLFAHATPFYLGSLALITGLGVAAAVAVVRAAGTPQWLWTWVGLLALAPASEFAVAFTNRVVHRLTRPVPLPRLDLRDGVPTSARTMVMVPTLKAPCTSASVQARSM